MENKSKLPASTAKKAKTVTRAKPKDNLASSQTLNKESLELRKQKTKEAFSLARLILICGVVVSLTIVLASKDSNLLLEILKIMGGGGIGYGIGKHFPKQ